MKIKIIGLLLFAEVMALAVLGFGLCRPNIDKKPPETSRETAVKSASQKEDTNTSEKQAPVPDKPENSVYEDIVNKHLDNIDGTVSYALHMYDTGYQVCNSDEKMKSASIIKLFIMEYAFNLVQKGELSAEDVISGRKLSDILESMITVSDNDATNILIDHFTMDKLNEFFVSRGYGNTKIARRMLDTAAASRGEENYTSAKDVMAFLDKLYNNKNTYPYSEMLSVMKRQQISTKLRRDMPQDVEMASKTGELSDTENDAAIVFTPKGDYAFVCLTSDATSSLARDAMAKACRALYDELQIG